MAIKGTIRHSENLCQEIDEGDKLKKRRQRWAYGGICEDVDNFQIEFIPERPQSRRTAYNNHVTCPERDIWFMALTKIFEACAEIHDEGCDDCEFYCKCSKIHSGLSERSSDRLIKDREATEFVVRFLKMILGVK